MLPKEQLKKHLEDVEKYVRKNAWKDEIIFFISFNLRG